MQGNPSKIRIVRELLFDYQPSYLFTKIFIAWVPKPHFWGINSLNFDKGCDIN
jgi:hypothetical protein